MKIELEVKFVTENLPDFGTQHYCILFFADGAVAPGYYSWANKWKSYQTDRQFSVEPVAWMYFPENTFSSEDK